MSRKNKRKRSAAPIYTFAVVWLLMCMILPVYKLGGLIVTIIIASCFSYFVGKQAGKKAKAQENAEQLRRENETQQPETEKKSYGPEIDPILAEGRRALAEMGRLYASIKNPDVRAKINEIMRITDKITQDAIDDPSDIPQIKKFLNYYLPTTIKLLNAYDRMSSQGIEGENLDKSMKNIDEMLDTVIAAYKKRLDSLFANQALDIETDIEVMNSMLAREGLAGGKDFDIKNDAAQAAQAQ